MKLAKKISAILLMFAAPLSMAVDGPHFTFTVPISLTNLPPEINRLRVSCAVSRTGEGIKGRAEATRTVSGGAFSGDVAVPITLAAPNNPALVDNYSCSVHLSGAIEGRPYDFLDDSNTRFPLAPGAPFRQASRGALPR
jgi:hypothetical protein